MDKCVLFLAALSVLLAFCAAPPPDGRGPSQPGPFQAGPQGQGQKGPRGLPQGQESGPGKGNGHGNGPKNDKQGPGNGKGRGWGARRRITDDALVSLKTTCRGRGNCKGKNPKSQKLRNAVKASLKANGRGKLDDAVIEQQLQKTLEAKKALFAVNGLNDVEPHDNGLIGGDMILNINQLDKIINTAGGANEDDGIVPLLDADQVSIPANLTRRKRGDMLAMDYYGGNKWPTTTINFYIGKSVSYYGNTIRAALKSISSVSCIKFVEQWKYPVIEFLKTPSDTDDGTCGWSSVGYQGDYNAVHINFDSSICRPTLQGVVVHEALHSLGFAHEHTRYDRDKYYKINWNNVDPQAYDVYDKDDPHDYNPYCIKFDPLSIMQYDPYVAAINDRVPVMSPYYYADYYLPRMGQGTKMSAEDAKLLNKMYCKSSTCKDKSTNCGWTACSNCATYGSVCAKSCGKC